MLVASWPEHYPSSSSLACDAGIDYRDPIAGLSTLRLYYHLSLLL